MINEFKSKTYFIERSIVFKKTNEQFGGLSNMAPGFPLVVNGVHIRTSEALYQACRFPYFPDLQKLIVSEKSPMAAKMKIKPFLGNTRPDWDKSRILIMRWCLHVKLVQNKNKLIDLIDKTDNYSIVELSRKDSFWGAKPFEDGVFVGQNVLGCLIMELREEIKNIDREKFNEVPPPNVPNFLFLEEPIRCVKESDKMIETEKTPNPHDEMPLFKQK